MSFYGIRKRRRKKLAPARERDTETENEEERKKKGVINQLKSFIHGSSGGGTEAFCHRGTFSPRKKGKGKKKKKEAHN